MNTGLVDYHGHKMHEGDYVRLVPEELRQDLGSVDWDSHTAWSEIGRVIWDKRRNSWQVLRMILPKDDIRPELWGMARVDWLGDYNSRCYELVIDGGIPLKDRDKFRASDKLKGDWHPDTYLSGGVEVKYMTYKEAHK